MNKQEAVVSQYYRIFRITVTTTPQSLPQLIAAAKIPPGRLMQAIVNPSAAISVADGYNSNFLLFSDPKTFATMDVINLVFKCASGTVDVDVELFYQDNPEH